MRSCGWLPAAPSLVERGRKCILTVREICSVLAIGDGVKPNIELTFGANGVPFTPANDLEMMAYGDFLIDSCHIWEGGVELVLMQQFCKRSWNE